MSRGRCQICGRKLGLRADGTVNHHHLKGAVCDGAGWPPVEVSVARLVERALDLHNLARSLSARVRSHREQRLNSPIEHVERAARDAAVEADRLTRRAKWIGGREIRRQKQMEKYGYTLE